MSTCYDIMKPNLMFAYGICKRGYALDLTQHGAKFISEAHIPGAALYGIGMNWDHESHPNDGQQYHGVGLRLDVGPKRVAHGELFEIPDNLWNWLDGIENNGYTYERKVVQVRRVLKGRWKPSEMVSAVDAWVYEHMYPFEIKLPDTLIEGGIF